MNKARRLTPAQWQQKAEAYFAEHLKQNHSTDKGAAKS
jgi:hypothetical protein